MKKGDQYDPKGLIFEAYRIEGITIEECRTIFLDWALSLSEHSTNEAIPVLLERHGQEGHPMNAVLQAGLEATEQPKRRGGRRARVSN